MLQRNPEIPVTNQQRAISLPQQWTSLAAAFVHQAKSQPHALAVQDSFGVSLTYRQLLVHSIALAHSLSADLDDTACVGVLLPPCAGAVIANIAIALLGKISVNLNYTTGQKQLESCISRCGLTDVITSSALLKKTQLEPSCATIFLESAERETTLFTKIKSWLEGELIPEELLGIVLPGLSQSLQVKHPNTLDKEGKITVKVGVNGEAGSTRSNSNLNDTLSTPATIIFTSGSTGNPKGVVLSNRNILSNIAGVNQQGHIQKGEVILGVIPFFHSFGLTMTLWAPLCLGETVIYHYDPLDARRIGELCQRNEATCLICTPTMMSSYIRRCPSEQFASLQKCVLGGEKLKHQQSLAITEKLGLIPLEGYGLAETSPVVACNVPHTLRLANGKEVNGTKPGTVGLPIPGTSVRIVDIFSKLDLPAGVQGVIQVKGPQVMLGYLNQPEETKRVLNDGWFSTGDIGFLDEEGFLTVTGRLSQFSKIAGEMVPHLAVEDEIMRITDLSSSELCVTSIPDEMRGERLVVISTHLNKQPTDVVKQLKASNLPRLWIPDVRDFIEVDAMPVMVNGKLDLVRLRQLALQKARKCTEEKKK